MLRWILLCLRNEKVFKNFLPHGAANRSFYRNCSRDQILLSLVLSHFDWLRIEYTFHRCIKHKKLLNICGGSVTRCWNKTSLIFSKYAQNINLQQLLCKSCVLGFHLNVVLTHQPIEKSPCKAQTGDI